MDALILETGDARMQQVIIGGDFAPIGRSEVLLGSAEGALVDDLRGLFQEADLVVANLECPLINRHTPSTEKGPVLGAKAACAKGIKRVGIDIVGLANNHILDHRQEGLESTIEALRDVDIEYVGAGKSIVEAKQMLIKEMNSVKLGFVAVAEHEFSIANTHSAGANPLDVIAFVRNMARYRDVIDFVIVLYHGGKEFHPYPSPRQMDICRFMVEQGASAVICQHSHCPGCYEEYKGGYIVYGQGNLLFDMYPKEMPVMWYEGFLVNLAFKKNAAIEFSITPYMQRRDRVGINKAGHDCMDLAEQIAYRSQRIKQDGFVETEWLNLCDKKRYEYLSYVHGYNRILSYINKKMHFTDALYSRRAYNLILNVMRCETHREVLETILGNRIDTRSKDKLRTARKEQED